MGRKEDCQKCRCLASLRYDLAYNFPPDERRLQALEEVMRQRVSLMCFEPCTMATEYMNLKILIQARPQSSPTS
jgi:hypothetical protein